MSDVRVDVSGGVKRSTIGQDVMLSLRLCVSHKHGTKDCGKVKSHASCKPTFVYSHFSEAEIWRLHGLWLLAIMYKQCHIFLSRLYIRFTEVVLHKHLFTTSMTLYQSFIPCS